MTDNDSQAPDGVQREAETCEHEWHFVRQRVRLVRRDVPDEYKHIVAPHAFEHRDEYTCIKCHAQEMRPSMPIAWLYNP